MNRFLVLALVFVVPLAQAQRMPVTTASDEARAHFEQGRARMAHADFAAARVHFDAALAADPAFGFAHLYRAVAEPGLGSAASDAHMRQAAAARVSDGERQNIDAYAAHLRGDHDAELAALTAAAARFPADPWLPFQLGNELMALERHEEAAAALRRAAAADPGFAGAYNLLGYNEMARGDAAAAERAFREYIRMAPDEANPYDSFGEFHMLNGRLDEAEAQFEMALARDPEFTVSRNNLVRIAVMRLDDEYERATRAGDPDAILALHAPNAVILPASEPSATGREALSAYFAAHNARPANITFGNVGIVVSEAGDMAYQIGTLTSPGGPGKYLTVYRRLGGEWQIVADTWSDDAPPATTAGTD